MRIIFTLLFALSAYYGRCTAQATAVQRQT